jgi:transposase
MDLQGEGESTKGIARRFEVSLRTVERCRKAVTGQESKGGTGN